MPVTPNKIESPAAWSGDVLVAQLAGADTVSWLTFQAHDHSDPIAGTSPVEVHIEDSVDGGEHYQSLTAMYPAAGQPPVGVRGAQHFGPLVQVRMIKQNPALGDPSVVVHAYGR